MLLNLLVKPGWLLVENVVQDRIGHADFGLFTALFSLTYIFAAFADFGISQYTTKRIAADAGFMGDFLPVLLPLKGAISLLFPALIVGYGWLIGYRGEGLYLLVFIALSFSLTQFVQFLRSVLQAHQHFNTDSIASVLDKFLLIGLVLVLLQAGMDLEQYVYVRVAVTIITFLIVYGIIAWRFGLTRYRYSWPHVKTIFRDSFPFALIALVYGVNERVDMVMLERLYSEHEAGIYAGAYRWVDAVMMYLWTVLPIFFAKFALSLKDRQEQQKLLRFGQVVVALPIIYVSVFTLFFGNQLFFLFRNSTAAELLQMERNLHILFLNVLVNGFFAIYSTLLTSSDFEKPVSWLVAVSILLNVGLNFLFIPEFGSVAASLNTLLSAVFLSGGYLVLVKRKLQIELPWGILGKLALAAGLLAAAFYLLSKVIAAWWLTAALAGLVYAMIVVGLQLVPVRQLILKIREKK